MNGQNKESSMAKVRHYRRFGEVTIQFFEKRDNKNGIGLGHGVGLGPVMRKVVIPAQDLRINPKTGNVLVDDEGMSIIGGNAS